MAGLLIDENLSEAIVAGVATLFPGSTHVRLIGLAGAPDRLVWDAARERGLVLLTRDQDFETWSVVLGPPPKCIHIDAFNPGTTEVIAALRNEAEAITAFLAAPETAFLRLAPFAPLPTVPASVSRRCFSIISIAAPMAAPISSPALSFA